MFPDTTLQSDPYKVLRTRGKGVMHGPSAEYIALIASSFRIADYLAASLPLPGPFSASLPHLRRHADLPLPKKVHAVL